MSKVLFICAEVSGSTKVYLFYFDVVFCWRCGPDQFFFFFFVVDPCCCLTANMNACFVVVVVVPILGFIFVIF